jgi:hypothetical protein
MSDLDLAREVLRRNEERPDSVNARELRLAFALERQCGQVRSLGEALRFYADVSNWGITRWGDGPHIEFLTVHEKPWERAAAALQDHLQEQSVRSEKRT